MSRLPSMPFFPADFFADTEHLTRCAAHAYLFLLGHAWLRAGALPNDDALLARMAGFRVDQWRKMKGDVLSFWEAGEDGFLRNKRLTRERDYVIASRVRNKANGALGGRPKLLKSNVEVKPNGCSPETAAKAPTLTPTLIRKKETRASALEFQQFWDWYGHKIARPKAFKAFEKARLKAPLAEILSGVERYHKNRPTWQAIQGPEAWLNGERWNDQPANPGQINGHPADPERLAKSPAIFVKLDTPQWNAWADFYRKSKGISPPMNKEGGWWFQTEWPPNDH